jgi:two-component system CheB/CheR fusion protein
MRRADGTVGGVVFYGIDVTDEVLARNAAREISDEREAILDQLPSGVITVTIDGTIRTMNTTGRQILGVSDGLIGRSAWDTLTLVDTKGDSLVPTDRPLKRALRGERVPATDYRGVVTATGQRVDLRISAAPLFDNAGKVRGAVAIFTPSRSLS